MLRNNLGLLFVGYPESEAALLCADLSDMNIKINYKAVNDLQDIRIALYEREWHVLICNHTDSCNFMEALEVWKQMGRDIPFIIYSDEIVDEKAISAIHHGAHDYVHKGQVARLAFVIQRELKNLDIRRAKLKAESKIYRLMYYDDLTGFPKRNLFCEEVGNILSKQLGVDKLAAVYFIKIGRLPNINSTYGYHVGDMLIQQLSYRMSVYTSGKCLLSKIGGGKFAFFKSDVSSLEDIQKFSDRIMRIAATPIMANNLEFYVTLNVGVSVYPTHGENISTLLANAENVLSESQDKWHSSCRYFMNEVSAPQEKCLVSVEVLRKAIINNEFIVFYQPIIDLESGDITGVEASLKWNHPEVGLIESVNFFPLAYENGLIIDIGKWMLRRACEQAKLWHESGRHNLFISIAISAIEIDQNHFMKYIQSVLAETQLSPNLLQLEISESCLQDVESNIGNLTELSNMGVRFSIKGYGKIGTSIRYMKQLPINSLKLDTVFISDIDADPENRVVVSAINVMARELGLSVIAEGVDTKTQLKFLHEARCDYAQGNYYSAPVNAEDFLKLLEQRKTGTLA